MSRPRLTALLLALLTLVVYLPAGRFGFVNYDDPDYVSANPVVQDGLTWPGVAWAFDGFHAANWHPLTWLSLMTDSALFGLNPGAFHFVNVLIHCANVVLLFALLWRLTGGLWPSAFVAALFAWHPLHVESVAWISERKDVLSTLFGLLALLGYVRFAREKSRRGYGLALIGFILSLLAKPMLVTLPFVFLLLDFWPLKRIEPSSRSLPVIRRLVVEKIPFFLLAIGSSVVTCLAQRGAMATLERVPFGLRLENSLVAYARYLGKIFWPADLAVLYPLAVPSTWAVAGAALALVAVTVLCWRARGRFPFALTGWLWFLGTLVPVIGLVQVGEQALADRYTYFPAIGIFIVLAFAGRELAGRFPSAKKIIGAAAALAVAACATATERQLQYWRSDEALFAHAVAATKNNEIAHLNLGVAYEKQGRLQDAMQEYQTALALNPRRAHTHNNIADLLAETGQTDQALTEYQNALRLDPGAVEAHLNLGTLLVKLGRYGDAFEQFDLAAKLKPADPRPPYETGKALLKQGRDAAAIEKFREALRLAPDDFQMLAFAARVLAADESAGARDGRAALAYATQANDLTGGEQPLVLDALGMALAENGDYSNAVIRVRQALEIFQKAQMTNTAPLQARLELYLNRQPWRESFRATNSAAVQE